MGLLLCCGVAAIVMIDGPMKTASGFQGLGKK
jgi:hypothetical protein